MEKLINKIFRIFNLSSIIFLIIGIILAFFPAISLSIISYSIAGILIVFGISFMVEQTKSIFWGSFSIGIVALILGIIILISPSFLTNVIPIFLGIMIILSGIYKINITINIKNAGNNNWIFSLIIAILNIICGIFLLLNPSFGAITITSLIGITLIIYSVSDIIDAIILKSDIKKIFYK